MECIKEEKLWEYLDGEIDSEEHRQIEEHLTTCSQCQAELTELMFFNMQFGNAIDNLKNTKPIEKKGLIEIELSYHEIKPQLKKYWKGIALFGSSILLLTLLFVTLACPISNKMIFETQFDMVTYSISQVLYFMVKPIVMNIWVIVLTFSFLFWIDKQVVLFNRQVQS